jgi:hypothetical protein
MLDLSHDLHLHIDLLIKDTVFHESSLLELFCSIWNPIILGSNLIDDSESTLADGANLVVLRAALPFSHVSTKRRR